MIKQYKNIFIELYGVILKEDEAASSFTLDERFIEFAEAVRGKYDLYLISEDDFGKSRSLVRNFGLDGYFKNEFLGSEMVCRRAGFEIFDKALERINAAPAECIYVDGNIQNILAAEEVGMAPILFYRGGDRFYDSMVYGFQELEQIL